MINITFNGKPHCIEANISLGQFLKTLTDDLSYAAIALNREFIPRDQYQETALKANDVIECVMPMQGG